MSWQRKNANLFRQIYGQRNGLKKSAIKLKPISRTNQKLLAGSPFFLMFFKTDAYNFAGTDIASCQLLDPLQSAVPV